MGAPVVPLPFAMWLGEHEGVLTVRLAGRLEAPWAEQVLCDLTHLCPAAVRLDLSGLTFIDSAGLTSLLAVRHDVLSGEGRFGLHGASGTVRAAFVAAGLDALVDEEPVAASTRRPISRMPMRGGRDARRTAAAAPRVA